MKPKLSPPYLAVLILLFLANDNEKEALIGDMSEEYYFVLKNKGRLYSYYWYWQLTLKSVFPLFLRNLIWSLIMFKSYLKTSFRNMMRYKVFSLINICGLALAIGCCLLILLWVQDELEFDKFHKNHDTTYRLLAEWPKYKWGGFEGAPDPLAEKMKEEIPGIEYATPVRDLPRLVVTYDQRAFYESGGIITGKDFFNIFSFPFIKGNAKSVFSAPYQIAISESFAGKYFGQTDPIDKTLNVGGQQLTIKGVFKDVPVHSHIQFNFVSPYEFSDKFPGHKINQWSAFNYVIYLKTKKNNTTMNLGNTITEIAKENGCTQVKNGAWFFIQPLKEVYLDGRSYTRSWMKLGDSKNVMIFSIIVLFVLFIACINFINLTTAQSNIRSKEIGIRKTHGADRKALIQQFYSESFFLVFIAFVVALIFLNTSLPFFSNLTGKNLELSIYNSKFLISGFLLFIVTAILAGSYPAFFMSSFKSVSMLKKNFQKGKRSKTLWGILIVIQFALSAILIVVTITASRQMSFIKSKKLGFNRKNMIQIPIKNNVAKNMENFQNELLKIPDVKSVSAQNYLLTDTARRTVLNEWEGLPPDMKGQQDVIYSFVDDDYFSTMELTMVSGLPFSKEMSDNECIINQQAALEMGLKEPLGKWLSINNSKIYIIGVMKDTLFQSLHVKVSPHLFLRTKDWSNCTSHGAVLVRTQGLNTTKTIKNINKVWKDFNPETPFEYSFMDQAYDNLYKHEHLVDRILNYFALFAIFISCIGLYGVSTLVIEQRKKEVGVRKVLGASTLKIVMLLSGKFLKWVIIANIISLPISFFVVKKFLALFAYQIDRIADIYFISIFTTVLIALITIGFHVYRAASNNPVNSLKYE